MGNWVGGVRSDNKTSFDCNLFLSHVNIGPTPIIKSK